MYYSEDLRTQKMLEQLEAQMDYEKYDSVKSQLIEHFNQSVIWNGNYYFFLRFEHDGLLLEEIAEKKVQVYVPIWFVQNVVLYE